DRASVIAEVLLRALVVDPTRHLARLAGAESQQASRRQQQRAEVLHLHELRHVDAAHYLATLATILTAAEAEHALDAVYLERVLEAATLPEEQALAAWRAETDASLEALGPWLDEQLRLG